jgi:hypothetical protein
VTETTADERGSDEDSEGEILSGADQKARRQAGSQAARGNPLVADEAEFTGESSGQEIDVSSAYDGVDDVTGDLASEKKILGPTAINNMTPDVQHVFGRNDKRSEDILQHEV